MAGSALLSSTPQGVKLITHGNNLKKVTVMLVLMISLTLTFLKIWGQG